MVHHEPDQPSSFPIGDLWVDVDNGEVVLPNGECARVHGDYAQPVVAEAAIRDLPLADVAEAFAELCERLAIPEPWLLSLQDNPHAYDAPRVRPNVAVLALGRDQIDVIVEIEELQIYEDEVFEAAVGDILAPLLRRWSAGLAREDVLRPGPSGIWVGVQLRLPTAGRPGADLMRFASEAGALLRAARDGPLDRQAARDLIVSGHSGALVGLREGTWLDAKGAPYQLGSDAGKYDLARDVSAFANAGGGIVLIPATTRVDRNGEVIDEVREVDLDRIDVGQIRDVLCEWVYPAIDGLEVRAVETTQGRGQLLVHVPPQPQRLWPHIVTRSSVGGRVRVRHVAICVRSDADTRIIEPSAIHTLLRFGTSASADHTEK